VTEKTMMTERWKLRWTRPSLQTSEEVMQFHATEAYCNLGLTRVQYRRQKAVQWRKA